MAAMPTPTLPEVLIVQRWPDEMLAEYGRGFGPLSPYVETFWLPVVGPTATWCFRRLAVLISADPEGTAIPTAELSGQLGLGHSAGRPAPLARGIGRLVYFGLAKWNDDALAVRLPVPTLSPGLERKLTPHLRQLHQWVLESASPEASDWLREAAGGSVA